MSIAISPEERDALYGRVLVRLSGIDGVFWAVEHEDWAKAQTLGEEFSDLLQLVCNDLGWGEGGDEPFTLQKTPPPVLRRAIEILRGMAGDERTQLEESRAKVTEEVDETRHMQEACERILASLDQS